MLYQLGPLQFTLAPLNTNDVGHDGHASHVEHPVMGAVPPLEFTGPGNDEWTVEGEMFPRHFGGLSELQTLHALRQSGKPQFLMRGDGTPMGWVVITRVSDHSTNLWRDGTGRVIRFSIALKQSAAPSASGMFDALMSLLP